MKTLRLALPLSVALLCLNSAHAADSAATAGSSSGPAAPAAESSSASGTDSGLLKKFEENHAITDAELKSREGSLTRFSLRANLSYFGPTLDDLSRPDQPNPDGAVSATAVGPSGSMGARYRLDSSTSVTANVGMMDQYLFTGKPSHMDVNNPFVTFDKSFKVGGVQMVASPGVTMVTSNVFKPIGETAGLDARLYSSYNVGTSPISLGASTTASYYFFNRDYIPTHQTGFNRQHQPIFAGDGRVRRIAVVFAPVVKYNVTSKFNVNTSWGFSFFNPRYYDDRTKFNSRVTNEWVGVGYAVTRDVYINPYVQFYPTQFTWKTATMNISTVFSLM